MQKHKLKVTSEDDEVRSQKSHYTNVSKTNSKHVELSLEVEMDDEVREIIKSPQKCSSALLDVTVIKPRGLDKYTTEKQILKMDQVKKMIAKMNLDENDKKTLMDKLFGEYTDKKFIDEKGEKKDKKNSRRRKSCLSPKNKHKIRQSLMNLEQGDVNCVIDETNSAIYSMYNQPSCPRGTLKTQQQIYTSPKTYDNIRTMFSCTNKEEKHEESNKMDQPCLCQNCAIVGILTDSQKIPFATEPIPDPAETSEPSRYRRPSRRKSVSFKHAEPPILPTSSKAHEHVQCEAVFKLLSSRIAELERRVAMQEEKAVPKEYFKKIITKLVTHLTRLTHYSTEEKCTASSPRHKEQSQPSSKYRSSDRHNRYYVNPILVDNTFKVPAEKEYEPKPCSSAEPPKSPTESLWKWGEEFLTSGRDLKNKVVVLLEETLQNLKKGWEKPEAQGKFDQDMQSMVEQLTKNLAETVRPKSHRSRPPEAVSLRSGKRMVSEAKNTANTHLDKKMAQPSLIPRFMKNKGPTVNVAYVNPQLKRWPQESAVSFKIDSSEYDLRNEKMSDLKRKQYKKEFLKVLANTKTADKFKLWQNIWNQALENHQTKKDLVTIQIPDPKDLIRQKMIHLEYTIGELEKLLTSASENRKK